MIDCPFCRTPYTNDDAKRLAMVQARIKKKDPEAINLLAGEYEHGGFGLRKDMRRAIELRTEAAELGSIGALFNLGIAYDFGKGVQEDKARAGELYKKAAMQGHVASRHNLGCDEGDKGNHDRAVRHYLISAKMGLQGSVENIRRMFIDGEATKEQYAQALKEYQDAMEEMKSHDRDEEKRDFGTKP